MPSPRFTIPQGTLDMLILQILSLESARGYGIARRLEQISRSSQNHFNDVVAKAAERREKFWKHEKVGD